MTGRGFPDKVVIQLNDTHPVLAIPELMRLLVDENGVGSAAGMVDHPPYLRLHLPHPAARGPRTWPLPMFGRLVRHLEIIYALNHCFPA